MFKQLMDDIRYVGLSIKRELIIFILMNLLLASGVVLLFYFKVTNFIIFMLIAFIPILDYLYLSRYKSLVRKIEENHNNEFISLLSYFELFISNHNNVYRSFEMLETYASEWMGNKISFMLEEIDQDKSVAPYIKFAKNFTYLAIENVMVSIFQMVEQGTNNENLMQFDFVFTSLNNVLVSTKVDYHEKSISSLNAFPLVGAGLITLTLTLSIVSILGELTYVV